MKTQSKWLWLLGLGTLVGLAIWQLTKKVSAAPIKTTLTPAAQSAIATIQASIASTEATIIPVSHIGTTNDPDADKHAQAIYTELKLTLPPDTYATTNRIPVAELLNIHALIPTPEQTAAGAVPLASNYIPPKPITLPGDSSFETVWSYTLQRYSVTLIPPVIPPAGTIPLKNKATGITYGWLSPAHGAEFIAESLWPGLDNADDRDLALAAARRE